MRLCQRFDTTSVCGQLMFGVATVTAGSGTVDDDEVDKSHFL